MSRQGKGGHTRTSIGTDQGIAGMTLIGGIDETLSLTGIMMRAILTSMLLKRMNSISSTRKRARRRHGRGRSDRGKTE